jgi:hypothetical protein
MSANKLYLNFILTIVLVGGIAACDTGIPTTGQVPSFSSVRFVHASANAPGVDILMDNRTVTLNTITRLDTIRGAGNTIVRIDTTLRADVLFAFLTRPTNVNRLAPFPLGSPNPAAYGGAPLAYNAFTPYIGIEAGNRNFKVFASPGGNAPRPNDSPAPTPVADINVDAPAQRATTVFISDTVGTAGGINPIVVLDNVPDFIDRITTNGVVRFAHLVPNAPGVRVLATRTSSAGITNRELFGETTYRQVREFVPLDSGTFRIDVVVGANTVASGTLSVVPRRAYTVFARGLVGRTAPDPAALGLTSYLNN